VEEALESAFLAEMIIKWLEKEKTGNRRLFIGRYWYGYTLGELAESQNVSQNKVTVTLHRMRKRLRRFLEREGISV
jgi:RNA polymerase sigma-70 factor (ECF subfamily)